MKKMIAMLLASVMAVGTFTTTAFAYTGDAVQENTAVSTAAQETDAVGSANCYGCGWEPDCYGGR